MAEKSQMQAESVKEELSKMKAMQEATKLESTAMREKAKAELDALRPLEE